MFPPTDRNQSPFLLPRKETPRSSALLRLQTKFQCITCQKWQHRRCVPSKNDPADYKRVKRCYIFKCSDCDFQNIANLLPSEAGDKSFILDESYVGTKVKLATEKVNSPPSQRPPTLFPQQCHQSTPLIFFPPARTYALKVLDCAMMVRLYVRDNTKQPPSEEQLRTSFALVLSG
ncbi:hypothetical protein OUZ56_018643 [Daphnia magna]|uniref:Uncharacterized protein n=1 Tax=Daphnia magna TaxID=35525 RepID=A0ABQ9Z9F7_9CRUS|nr:hypothetical protein OUZ56_018643 [Daphnia magna]